MVEFDCPILMAGFNSDCAFSLFHLQKDKDVDFSISCSADASMNVSVKTGNH